MEDVNAVLHKVIVEGKNKVEAKDVMSLNFKEKQASRAGKAKEWAELSVPQEDIDLISGKMKQINLAKTLQSRVSNPTLL